MTSQTASDISPTRLRLAIIAHFACGAMTGGAKGHVGGVERQTTLMARWFAAKGYNVRLITWDEGVPDGAVIDGVKLHTICKVNAGLRGVRFFHPRTTGLWAAMKRADADLYYHNCAEYYTGLIAHWCRRNGRKFVFSAAHDYDCDARLQALPKSYERILYRFGLRRADRVIVQTDVQRRLMKESFSLDSIALPMACPGPSTDEYAAPSFPAEPVIVWVGRLVPQKRPDWLLEIAARLPEVRFEVAGASANTTPFIGSLLERAKTLPNVNWLGTVSRDRMPELYRRALCLCSTSVHEGFPNTFLEAWSHGKPLLTTFDPDGLVARLNLGVALKDIDGFVAAIRGLMKDPAAWRTMSRNARAHYEENYTVDASNSRFEQQFLSVCGRR